MGYVEESLVPGEVVAYRTRLHWIVFAPALLGGAALGLVGLVIVAALVRGHAPAPMILIGALLLLLGAGWLAAAFATWRATEITVTTRRVLIKTGILRRHTKEILLAKVESVAVEESLTARALGFGIATIHGTGGTPEVFDRVYRPHELRRQIQIQIEGLSTRWKGGA